MSSQYNSALVTDMARLGKPFCKEDNKRLYPLVAAGDADARRQMIEGNMSLVVTKVDAFLAEWPVFAHLRDDLMSAGFMGLAKAVNKMAAGRRVRNPTSYLGSAIKREFDYLLESEAPIRVPHSSRFDALKNDEELAAPTVTNTLPERQGAQSSIGEVDVRDLFDSCCTCQEERTIVGMCAARHTHAEIAKAIGRPASSTYVMARKVKARIRQNSKAFDDSRIFLDLDDVCNTLAPYVLSVLGCPVGPSDYASYPREHGFNISEVANEMLGEARYTPATLWASIPRAVWVRVPESDIFHWLLETCERLVGRENICIATSPTKDPECLAGKLEWIHDHFPEWMHRQYAITPRKHLFARPDSLLIDDCPANTGLFKSHGGRAILVPRPWNDAWGNDPKTYLEENLARLP